MGNKIAEMVRAQLLALPENEEVVLEDIEVIDDKHCYVVAGGNAFDGLVLHGPFDEIDEALAYAEASGDEWQVVKVWPKED